MKSYFGKGKKDGKTERLVRRVEDMSIVLTRNEKEAFLLENNLIKEHQPKYNMVLKDDKTYVSLRLSVQDKFPALSITRTIKDDGALYFGPHPHAKDAKDLLKVVQSLYPMRRCRDAVFQPQDKAVHPRGPLDVSGPLRGGDRREGVSAVVEEVADFLQGRNEKLLKMLEAQIEEAARSWNFEEAQARKEKYDAIKRLVEKQRVHEHMGINRDVWGILAEEGRLRMVVLTFRKGVLISKRTFKESFAPALDDALPSFLFQYYSARPIPDEIVLSEEIGDKQVLEQTLREKKKGRVRIHGPVRQRHRRYDQARRREPSRDRDGGARRGVQESAPSLEAAQKDRSLRYFSYPRAKPVGHHGRIRGLQGKKRRITGSSTYGRRRPRTMWP